MKPNGEEVLRGIQGSLTTYVLPELQSAYARTELMIALGLLGVVADQWDAVAQRLVDDNAALRELARRGAEALGTVPGGDTSLAHELRSLAQEADASLRLSDLSITNGRLRDAIARLGVALQGSEVAASRALRTAIIEHLRAEAESRSHELLGPRADG